MLISCKLIFLKSSIVRNLSCIYFHFIYCFVVIQSESYKNNFVITEATNYGFFLWISKFHKFYGVLQNPTCNCSWRFDDFNSNVKFNLWMHSVDKFNL